LGGGTWEANGLVFTTPLGTALDLSNVRKSFLKILTAAELGGVHVKA